MNDKDVNAAIKRARKLIKSYVIDEDNLPIFRALKKGPIIAESPYTTPDIFDNGNNNPDNVLTSLTDCGFVTYRWNKSSHMVVRLTKFGAWVIE